MRRTFVALLFLAICPMLVAQQALNNDAVIKLAKAGLSDDLIVSTVSASPGTYDASADGLIALKAAGVSDKVIAAIVTKANAPVAATPAATGAPAAADPNDPLSLHEPGLYMVLTGPSGKPKMVQIERTVSTNEHVGNGFGSLPIKAKIPEAHAVLRTSESKPVFYIYFPSGSGFTDIASPSQFSLLTLDAKKDHREVVVGRIKQAGYDSKMAYMGFDNKAVISTSAVKVHPYPFKVTPDTNLPPGEYAFIAKAGLSESQPAAIFDFGVDAK